MVSTGDFPQADRLLQVGRVAQAVAAGHATYSAIEKFIGLASDGRQGRYYRLAAEILGLVKNDTNNAYLTDLGYEYASLTTANARTEFLARCVVETEVFSEALRYIRRNSPTEQQLRLWFRNFYPGASTTADRRYSTFVAYLKQVNLVSDATGRIQASVKSVAVEKTRLKIESGVAGKSVRKEFVTNTSPAAKSVINFEVDAQKRERASQMHWNLVVAKTGFLKAKNLPAEENAFIDLYSKDADDIIIYEMKSVFDSNLPAQIRRAVAQLYEYRYIFSSPNARLCIVTNKPISKADSWLTDYLANDRKIAFQWTEDLFSFECGSSSKRLLDRYAP